MSTAVQVKERPILFSGPMVKAILEGRKTQTRRVIRDGPKGDFWGKAQWSGYPDDLWYVAANLNPPSIHTFGPCLYGKPGDRLWVRETWRADDYAPDDPERTIYAADIPDDVMREAGDLVRWRPSIFLPRNRSRLSLKILSVRVERLQDINHIDAEAEGAVCSGDPDGLMGSGNVPKWSMTGDADWRHCLDTAIYAFGNGWNKLNAKRGFGWASNPWVWVVEFRKL